MAVGRLLSHGAPDSPVRHRTLSGAPVTSADRWGSSVGALTCEASGLSGGAPDMSCRLSGAPTARALTLARTVAHWMLLQSTVAREVVVAPLAHRTVRCDTGQSGVTPDSPVLHWTVRWIIAERPLIFSKVASSASSALVHRTVRCARPGCLLGCLLLSLFEPFLGLLLAYCEPLAPVELID
jgi:hypothetical protein